MVGGQGSRVEEIEYLGIMWKLADLIDRGAEKGETRGRCGDSKVPYTYSL